MGDLSTDEYLYVLKCLRPSSERLPVAAYLSARMLAFFVVLNGWIPYSLFAILVKDGRGPMQKVSVQCSRYHSLSYSGREAVTTAKLRELQPNVLQDGRSKIEVGVDRGDIKAFPTAKLRRVHILGSHWTHNERENYTRCKEATSARRSAIVR